MRRKGFRTLVLVSFALSLGVVAATAIAKRSTTPPKNKILIKDCADKKPPVHFDHPQHVKYMKTHNQTCEACHHKVKGKTPEHDKCSTCHIKQQGKMTGCKDKSKKKNPFHKQCIGCHKKLKAAKADFKGPTKCKGCHAK